jgi:hypothetical protein
MSSPAALPNPPSVQPQAIRACLTPTLAAEFDREWRFVLAQAKESSDLIDRHELLNKWQHIAYQELCDPGSYYRPLARAEQIMRAGGNPDGVPFEAI